MQRLGEMRFATSFEHREIAEDRAHVPVRLRAGTCV
jgi:hypothetical protein